MPNFQYVATDQFGAQSQGTFEAANEQQAYEQLAQYGLSVSQVIPLDPPGSDTSAADQAPPLKKSKGKAKKAKKKKGGRLDIQLCGGPTSEDITDFTRQMSTLVQAGLPLLRSLEVMIKQQEKSPSSRKCLVLSPRKSHREEIYRTGWRCIPKLLIIFMLIW